MLAVPRSGRPARGGTGGHRRHGGARQVAAPEHPSLSRQEVATRAGVEPAYVDELVRVGILSPGPADRLTPGDARRVTVVRSLQEAGLALEAIGTAVGQGLLSLSFADSPTYERFATLTSETFEAVSARTGIPFSLLAVVREAVGGVTPRPSDLLREDELRVLPFIEIQLRLGFRPLAIERLMRAMSDSLHRLAEAEAEWFRSEVSEPMLAAGRANEITDVDPDTGLSEASEAALLAIYQAQQAQTWTSNIIGGFEYVLSRAGLHKPSDRPPAICFLDITGYTRLTQERGDRAAADLAEELSRIVTRSSKAHGGRPIKWLGDGVMFYFRDPALGVASALEMVTAIPAAGLPPAHVGLHAGPVVLQQGDFYGQTVNMAARIADYARPGEVLVSQAIVDTAGGGPVTFVDIGDVELKGVVGAVRLHAATSVARP